MQTIKGYEFTLYNPIFLNSPKNKFWEVTIASNEVRYRCGVLRADKEFKIKEAIKEYDSHTLAKAKVITKIAEKIDKGYFSVSAKKVQQDDLVQMKPVRRNKMDIEQTKQESQQNIGKKQRKSRSKQTKSQMSVEIKDPHKRLWKGFEKGDQRIQLDLIGNKLTTTKKTSQGESNQGQYFPSYDSAVNFIHRKQRVLEGEGFKPMVSEVFEMQKQSPQTIKKVKSNGNPFAHSSSNKSLTAMTDHAIELKSGLNIESSGQNVYLPNPRLGPSTNQPIKCLLAENYKEKTNPSGWIMSQKLDGVRCLWTGSQMYSRNGNKFYFPRFFTKNWPNSQLDGQLFIGRGQFSQTLSAVKKSVPVTSEWQKVKYLVFDAPGLKEPFQTRINILEEELGKIDNSFIKCHAHRPCQNFAEVLKELQQVNQAGGQGIMLRQPKAFYQNKRSKNLQKVKTFHDDEAEIIGYTEGAGRCTGWIGALRVRNGKGIQFQVGSGLTDEMRQDPPQVGLKITYKYQQFNKDSGKPRFPTFLRMYKPL